MRIVLDTNILVRANIKAQGPARDLLLQIARGDHLVISSPFLLRELERALAYPRIQNFGNSVRRIFRSTCNSLK